MSFHRIVVLIYSVCVCRPRGAKSGTYCTFTAFNLAAKTTTLYNISASDSGMISSTHLPGIAYNLHSNFLDGSDFAILQDFDDHTAEIVIVALGKVVWS